METKLINVFHDGEKQFQTRAGTRDFAQKLGEMKILNHIPDEFKEFVQNRHAVWISSMNKKSGEVWSSVIFSSPVHDEADRESRHIQNIENDRLNYMNQLEESISEMKTKQSNPRKKAIKEKVESTIKELKLKEVILELEEEGILDDEDQLTPESEVGSVLFCKPFDSCSVGSYASNLTSRFQSICYRPLIHIESRDTLHILKKPLEGDPLIQNIKPGSLISLNFIEFESRKRFRTNCVVKSSLSDKGFSVHILEAFSTCPKYIHRRTIVGVRDHLNPTIEKSPKGNSSLPSHLVQMIIEAETFMIATIDPKRGADSSHRGGRKGFVRVIDNSIIVWGDYVGKGMFQTLGNTAINPNSGLLFMNWEEGGVLQLTGTIEVDWEQKTFPTGPATGLDGSERTVIFRPTRWIYQQQSPYIWKYLQPSSHSPLLQDNFKILNHYGSNISSLSQNPNRDLEKHDFKVSTRLVEIRNESPNARTFKFKTGSYIAYQPGQYSTWTINIDGVNFIRSWTISSAHYILLDFNQTPVEHEKSMSNLVTDYFEITVKRKEGGFVSNYLMDLEPNKKDSVKLTLMGIEGNFTLFSSAKMKELNKIREWKIAMISGGIGMTPIISMLRGVKNSFDAGRLKKDQLPDIVTLHTEQTIESIPFKKDLQSICTGKDPLSKLAIAITLQSKEEINEKDRHILEHLIDANSDYLRYGRINSDFIKSTIPDIKERVIYLCGPEGFMSAIVKILKGLGVSEYQIVTESFTY